MQQLPYKNVLLGMCGGIAAYKSAELVRLLVKAGCDVRVVMSDSARAFISPMTMQALSTHAVHSDLFDEAAEAAMGHIELAKWAELVLIAPATANTIAKLAHGLADNLLSNICLASTAPIALVPAMNQAMWHNTRTQHNIALCQQHQMRIIGPGQGEQACGDTGFGRMLEPRDIIEQITAMQTTQPLRDQHVLITAGATREAIDPVRFLSNPSTGKMGFALARAAASYGARVTLIAGAVELSTPPGVERIDVNSAVEMHTQATQIDCDIFIGCAAVADYRPAQSHSHKIKKSSDSLSIELVPNPDILASISHSENRPFCVGFAAETQAFEENALKKLDKKSLDMIILNDVSRTDTGFASDHNQAHAFWRQDNHVQSQQFSHMPKTVLAQQLLELITQRYASSAEKI